MNPREEWAEGVTDGAWIEPIGLEPGYFVTVVRSREIPGERGRTTTVRLEYTTEVPTWREAIATADRLRHLAELDVEGWEIPLPETPCRTPGCDKGAIEEDPAGHTSGCGFYVRGVS